MPVRKRRVPLQTNEPDPLNPWTWGSGSGCVPLIPDFPAYRTEAAARRAWNKWRRAIWADTHVGNLPNAAEFYDGLTRDGISAAASEWGRYPSYDHERVQVALDADRAAIDRFQHDQPKAAQAIADYLDLFGEFLDRVEANSRTMHRSTTIGKRAGRHPYGLMTATKYAEAIAARLQ
jgi:hypothetical protein